MPGTKQQDGIIVTHSGRQHSYRVAAALDAAGMLERFVTSSYYKPEHFPDRLAKPFVRLDSWLRQRHLEGLDPARVVRFPQLELPEVVYRRVFRSGQHGAGLVAWRDSAFDRRVSDELHRWGGRAFWGFQGSCAESVVAAKRLGMPAVVEYASVPADVARTLMEPDRTGRAAAGPLEQADFFIAASTFSAKCLEQVGVPPDRIRLIPLGVDLQAFPFRDRCPGGPLKVLFVGKLARHKGISYLMDAMRSLRARDVLLSIVGPKVGGPAAPLEGTTNTRYMGELTGASLVRAFHDHDVLVVPSLYEGFGFVILEAMASGMAVVASANSCAPDVVREGIDGLVIPARDAGAIAESIDWCAGNRHRLAEMGRSASTRAREYSWERHRDRVVAFGRQLLGAGS